MEYTRQSIKRNAHFIRNLNRVSAAIARSFGGYFLETNEYIVYILLIYINNMLFNLPDQGTARLDPLQAAGLFGGIGGMVGADQHVDAGDHEQREQRADGESCRDHESDGETGGGA
jgi:hypothetical protein